MPDHAVHFIDVYIMHQLSTWLLTQPAKLSEVGLENPSITKDNPTLKRSRNFNLAVTARTSMVQEPKQEWEWHRRIRFLAWQACILACVRTLTGLWHALYTCMQLLWSENGDAVHMSGQIHKPDALTTFLHVGVKGPNMTTYLIAICLFSQTFPAPWSSASH